MDWTPYVVFVITGVFAAVAQRRYLDELVRGGGAVSSDESIARQIRDRPGRLINIAAIETVRRLRALVTRQDGTRAERLRVVALLAITATPGCAAWTILSLGPT